jgi:hypothetical protein
MQKLSGTSSGKNNKSCRIIHKESNKIEFAFFCFFYDFLRILQVSANHKYYSSYNLSLNPLDFFRFTTKPLLCGSALRKSSHLAMWPLGVVAGAAGGNPARSGGGAGRGRAWGGLGVHLARFGALVEEWRYRRRCLAATAGTSRGGLLSGDGRARPERHATVRAWVGAT